LMFAQTKLFFSFSFSFLFLQEEPGSNRGGLVANYAAMVTEVVEEAMSHRFEPRWIEM